MGSAETDQATRRSVDPRDGAAVRPATLAAVAAVAADAGAVLLFVLLGRRAHDEGSLVAGTASVAWPFLTGLLLGWAALLVARRPPPSSIRGGLVVLAVTVTLGMVLRRATGGGVQLSFVIVATVVLAVFLLGRRLLPALVRRVRTARG